MVVILSSPLLCKTGNLIFKLNKKQSSYLDTRWLFIGRFKVKSVPGMRNKHKPYLYLKLHNELKSYLAKKKFEIYYSIYIEERWWVKAVIVCDCSMFSF